MIKTFKITKAGVISRHFISNLPFHNFTSVVHVSNKKHIFSDRFNMQSFKRNQKKIKSDHMNIWYFSVIN